MLRKIGTIVVAAVLAMGQAAPLNEGALPDEPFAWITLNDQRARLQFYPFGECMPECPQATTICENGEVRFTLHDFFPTEIVTWFEIDDGPFRGDGVAFNFVVRSDGVPMTFPVSRLDRSDFSGNWGIESSLSPQQATDWLGVFATAVDIVVETPTRQIALSSRPEDRMRRAAFVGACLAI